MRARHTPHARLVALALVVAFTPALHAQSDIDRLRARAEQGDPTAQFNLARLYATGIGVPLSETDADAAAAQWYRLAAAQGHAGAQHGLGLKYDTGIGVPEDDAEAITSATQCFVTGGLAGTSYGSFDVDGGPTDLISPPFDLAGTDATVSYSRWFFSTGTDTLIVSVSGNGATWFTVETVTSNNTNQWLVSSFRVGDHIIPTATVQVRFRAMDNPNNDITEAAIDVFRIQEFVCDVCQPDIGYGGPGNGVLSLCGGDLSSGTTANFKLENGPTSSLVYVGATPTLNPIPFGGGTLIHPNAALLIQLPTDSNGEINIPLGGGGGPYTQYAQSGWIDPSVPFGVALSNAIQGNWLQ